MKLNPGGIDIFYIDESHDKDIYAVTAVCVPFLQKTDDDWHITWDNYLKRAQLWRRAIADTEKIPTSKELHGTKLVAGRGNFLYGNRQLPKEQAANVYRNILATVDFLPKASVITVVGRRGRAMYGHERLERVMYALFQRMRRQCEERQVNAMTFFDEGHPEYRTLYRRARVNLPTGSRYGGTRNLPLDMFVKDANEKISKNCLFTQIADLISYAALSKVRNEYGSQQDEHQRLDLHTLFDSFPSHLKNLKASGGRGDGIVRLG